MSAKTNNRAALGEAIYKELAHIADLFINDTIFFSMVMAMATMTTSAHGVWIAAIFAHLVLVSIVNMVRAFIEPELDKVKRQKSGLESGSDKNQLS